jgi:hypothetical protein
MRVVGMPPEIAFGNDAETGRFDFLAQRALLDAMERLADRSPLARQGGMIRDHQKAAGLERGEHVAVHLGAIDVHVCRIVVVEEECDQVEIVHARTIADHVGGALFAFGASRHFDHPCTRAVLRLEVCSLPNDTGWRKS